MYLRLSFVWTLSLFSASVKSLNEKNKYPYLRIETLLDFGKWKGGKLEKMLKAQ